MTERKVFGPRDPAADPGYVDGRRGQASSGSSGRGSESGSSKPRSRNSSFDDNARGMGPEDRKSSGSKSSGRAGSPTSRSVDSVDVKKERRKSDVDGKSPSKGGAADKSKPAVPAVTPEGTVFAELPKLRDTPAAQQADLVRRKLQECCKIYDFKHVDAFLPEKEGKRQTLVEMVDHVATPKNCFATDDSLLSELVDMVCANIFRTLTKRERAPLDMLDLEDDEPPNDTAWPHLELVYELLLRLVSAKEVDTNAASKYVTQKFVLKLLELFESDDPRERESLKTIVNRIHSKFGSLRSTIRRAVQNICLRAVTDKEVVNGLQELLEILARIINGFSTPLKDESRDVLRKVLIPLHKVDYLGLFHSQLLDCTKKFTDKDPQLAVHVVSALLRYWPCTIAAKQLLFLSELEDMIVVMPSSDMKRVQAALGRRIAACVSAPNSDVAERTLALWRSDRFVKLMTQHCKDQFPAIISALYHNSTQHWHNSVHTRTIEVLKMLMELDAGLFDASSSKHRKNVEEDERKEADRERKWAALQVIHDRKKAELAAQAAKKQHRRSSTPAAQTGSHRQPTSPRGASPRSGLPTTAAACGTTQTPHVSEHGRGSEHQRFNSGASRAGRPRGNSTNSQAFSMGAPGTPSGMRGGRDEVAISKDSCGFAVTWDGMERDVWVELQAVVVDGRGRIIDAVTELNPTALQAIVRRPPETSGTSPDGKGEGNGHGHGGGMGATVWVALSRLPVSAALLIFVLCAPASGRLGDVVGCVLRVVGEARPQELASFPLEHRPISDAGVIAVVRRATERSWSILRMEEFGKSGRNFVDIAEATVSKVIKEAIPAVPKRHKPLFAFSALARGAVVCMPHPSVAKHLFVGISWDLSPSIHGDGAGVGLALAAVFFNSHGHHIGAVCPDTPEAMGARHGGVHVLGQGLILDVSSIPQEAAQICIVGHLASKSTTFDCVQRPLCCIVDPQGSELLRHPINAVDQGSEIGSLKNEAGAAHSDADRGLLAGRFLRCSGAGPWSSRSNPTGSTHRWAFQALGGVLPGHTWKESIGELQTVCLTPPDGYQTLPPDIPQPGPRIVSL